VGNTEVRWQDLDDAGLFARIDTIHRALPRPLGTAGSYQRSIDDGVATAYPFSQSHDTIGDSLQIADSGLPTWDDNQLLEDIFLQNDAITLMSPSTSSASAITPESASQSLDVTEKNDQSGPDSSRSGGAIDGNALHRLTLPSSAPDRVRAAQSQARKDLIEEWKVSKKPNPTWSKPRNEPWEPLLHTAAIKGQCDILQLLIDHDADISERDDNGCSALHLAIEHQQEAAVMLLLQNGVDVNACDAEGRTALSMAVNNGCETGVRIFLMHGADPSVVKTAKVLKFASAGVALPSTG
jgi:hypothetical protein